ncbi:hypothetical protein HII36_52520 [Nonomuraea sp. NN258]|uniref:hypothetical protein n=1 Tax=Nonomuraea antri TaxID=2730852 RepID=UPI001568CC54|nr:hypothetical protein [Nonomuraea antri]NRQ40390.1 hypothetical protein [Nonomuraea antri]
MHRRSALRVTLSCLAAVAVLGGCGGASEDVRPAPATSAASGTKAKKQRLEAVMADCMKRAGFKYVPYVQPEKQKSAEEKLRAAGDYQAMRKYREKYGFGVFSIHVYPEELNNPAVKPANAPDVDPNLAIQSKLSKTQFTAYRQASEKCRVDATKQVIGKVVKSTQDYYEQINRVSAQRVDATINSDPALVELATSMATCLKGKGYRIGKATPSALYERGRTEFHQQEDKLGRAQRDDVPDVAPPSEEGDLPMYYVPTLTPQEARPYLTKEIRAALDDLECGRRFYPAYLPRQDRVNEQVAAEFGMW